MLLFLGYFIYWCLARGAMAPDAVCYLVLALWLAGIALVSHWSARLWTRYVGAERFVWLLFPGSLVHRLSHALAALLMGCSVTGLRLYALGRDEVQHSEPAAGVLGRWVVWTAPVLAGVLAIALAHDALGRPAPVGSSLPSGLVWQTSGLRGCAERAWGETRDAWTRVVRGADFGRWETWVFVGLGVVLVVTLAPKSEEVAVVVWGLVVASLVLFAADRTGYSILRRRPWLGGLGLCWQASVWGTMAAEAGLAGALLAAGVCHVTRGLRGGK